MLASVFSGCRWEPVSGCRSPPPWDSGCNALCSFPRDGQFELFDALASEDKRLLARSGRHAETHPDDEAAWQEFIALNARAPDALPSRLSAPNLLG